MKEAKGQLFGKGSLNLLDTEIQKEYSVSEIKPDNESIYLTLKLSYKGELIEDRTTKKQLFVEIPTGVQETKRKIYEKYMNAKHQTNINEKGVLFEQVVEEIVNLVPGLKVVGSDINNGICISLS